MCVCAYEFFRKWNFIIYILGNITCHNIIRILPNYYTTVEIVCGRGSAVL